MKKLLYKGVIICFAVAITGCTATGNNGTAVEEVDLYEGTPGYVPVEVPESPELFDLPRSYAPGMGEFYDRPFDELYY